MAAENARPSEADQLQVEFLRSVSARPVPWPNGTVSLRLGRVLSFDARATPAILIAVSVLVTGILLAIPPIVRAARRPGPSRNG